MPKLKQSFYHRQNVVKISQELLGKSLFTHIKGQPLTGGIIIETEAYAGPEDKASHAYQNRRTKRTEVMFHKGGVAYVYLCYGIHSLFNVVTNIEGIPHAILIRAIKPTTGIDTILDRRNKQKMNASVASGPGTVSQALNIDTSLTGISLTGQEVWIEDKGISFSKKDIVALPRVGVEYAGDDAKLPWRFKISENLWTTSPSLM